MENRPKISIAIPTHQTTDGEFFVRRLLDSLWDQTFQDFEVVISDNSDNYDIRKVCEHYGGFIKYFHNPPRGMAQNHNSAIKRSTGELVKVMQMDDYFAHDEAIEQTITNFKGEDSWMICGCLHDDNGKVGSAHFPEWNNQIYTGLNTLGGISTLTLRNDDPMLFDEELSWVVDCDLYYRYYLRYGLPRLRKFTDVVIDRRTDRLTHTLPNKLKENEINLMKTRYDQG